MQKPSAFMWPLVVLGICGCINDDNAQTIATAVPTATPAPTPLASIALERVFADLTFNAPVAMLQAPGDDQRWYVVEQAGMVRVAQAQNAASTAVFADIRGLVESGGEKGLLGMAFHPRFSQNNYVFLSYTGRRSGTLYSFISRFRVLGGSVDAGSESVVLQVQQPYDNHNGGQIAFGSDGYLYIGLGDGGSGGDPQGNGQNTGTLLGKMLRVDVDGGAPYGIPPDNPFAKGGGRAEIFAYGLRNPWRWSFDRVTRDLWAADVGQNEWEEVDVIIMGGNYGWNIREGRHCFMAPGCNTVGLIEPVAEYSHSEGYSITGGYVYRGARVPALQGIYVYGDFGSGRIWGIAANPRQPGTPRLLSTEAQHISSFAEDNQGELYVLEYYAGSIYRLGAGN